MTITPINEAGKCLTGNLKNVTVEEITHILGFKPNIKDDPYKVKHSWGFNTDVGKCGVWDYKGSEKSGCFSTFGRHSVFKELFGDRYVAFGIDRKH